MAAADKAAEARREKNEKLRQLQVLPPPLATLLTLPPATLRTLVFVMLLPLLLLLLLPPLPPPLLHCCAPTAAEHCPRSEWSSPLSEEWRAEPPGPAAGVQLEREREVRMARLKALEEYIASTPEGQEAEEAAREAEELARAEAEAQASLRPRSPPGCQLPASL